MDPDKDKEIDKEMMDKVVALIVWITCRPWIL
jgi:hypothetical protein